MPSYGARIVARITAWFPVIGAASRAGVRSQG